MLTKAAILFLAAMVVMALVGRALFPGSLRLRRDRTARPRTCPACGRFQIGTDPCPCAGTKRRLRG